MNNNKLPVMNESEIKERVESLAGPNARILDCEKKSSVMTEEVLLLNGEPVRLIGEAGEKIKAALKAGLPPPPEVLSEILLRAGIQTAPVQLETVMSVKSNTKTSEVSTLKDSQGNMLDEKMKEFEEDDEFESTNVELWEKEPQHLREQLKQEKNRMWDFYNNVKPHIPNGKPPTDMTFEQNETSKSTFSAESHNQKKGPLPKVPPTPPSRPPPPTPPSTPNYANGTYTSQQNKPQQQSPSVGGKMPHLSRPSDPRIRPIVPPKPAYNRELHLPKNFSLPVRVVYETFI